MKTKLIALVAVCGVLFVLGFRIGHPQDGLQSAMGSAKSSLIIYKHSSEYSVGQKVAVIVAGQGLESGIVKSATKDTVDVDTRVAFVRVKQEEVLGKLMLVVPFFGIPFNFIGL